MFSFYRYYQSLPLSVNDYKKLYLEKKERQLIYMCVNKLSFLIIKRVSGNALCGFYILI